MPKILPSSHRSASLTSLLVLAPCLLALAAADQVAPAPAPSPSDPTKCDCNPAAQEASGVCLPFKLPTAWSCQVDPHNPLPEYPRPQLSRPQFQSLNGIWEWERADTWDSGPVPFNRTLDGSIVVPYPVEADLSGLTQQNKTGVYRMWYRRHFKVNKGLSQGNETRIKLNYGAVDWEAEVYVNGVNLGMHQGGYDKFSYDITDALTKGDNGTHELIVRVFDPTEFAHIPLGKQRRVVPSTDIFYTSSSGIWQTVWMEPVNAAHVTRLDLIPDIDSSSLSVLVHGSDSADGLVVQVDIYFPRNGTAVASAQGMIAKPFNVTIPNQRLWTFDDPFLYDARVRILRTPSTSSFGLSLCKALPVVQQTSTFFDEVMSYAGMRKIALGKSTPTGPLRIFLNNEPLLFLGTLDQGFHPDGIYTAATDEALLFDIQAMKDMGMNIARKHIKVEPDRWYYHADRLGMLVWQDMVSMYWEKPYLEGEGY
ncbi:hypothetical protein WJX75_003952 [Coccomyxa subellipsoidea]|uniref:Glycosyl hydrolases family 2 sugar binding domain-containing protein n=1 Tax=Coccomyxa subellipsoidea TaxID=248742 RepID=A0ABR2YMS0_9CHLO